MSEALLGEDDCMICFEKPEMYGLLEECDHQFCLECIEQWRSSSDTSAWTYPDSTADTPINTGACPLCRRPSEIVFPAAKMPRNQSEKVAIMISFYKEKKRILCRDFEASLNSIEGFYCPRFNKCLYAHLQPVDDPNSMIRTKAFEFTEARIRQLQRRRMAHFYRSDLPSRRDGDMALPIDVATYAYDTLASFLRAYRVDSVDQGIEAARINWENEFLELYDTHLRRLLAYADDASIHTLDASIHTQPYPPAICNMNRHSTPPVVEHIIHTIDENGAEGELDSRPEYVCREFARNGLHVCAEPLAEHASHGWVVHHFLTSHSSMQDVPEAYIVLADRLEKEQTDQSINNLPINDVVQRQLYHIFDRHNEYLLVLDDHHPIHTIVLEDFPPCTVFHPYVESVHTELGLLRHHFYSAVPAERLPGAHHTVWFAALRAAIMAQRSPAPPSAYPSFFFPRVRPMASDREQHRADHLEVNSERFDGIDSPNSFYGISDQPAFYEASRRALVSDSASMHLEEGSWWFDHDDEIADFDLSADDHSPLMYPITEFLEARRARPRAAYGQGIEGFLSDAALPEEDSGEEASDDENCESLSELGETEIGLETRYINSISDEFEPSEAYDDFNEDMLMQMVAYSHGFYDMEEESDFDEFGDEEVYYDESTSGSEDGMPSLVPI